MMTGSIIDFDQQVLGAGDSPAAPPAGLSSAPRLAPSAATATVSVMAIAMVVAIERKPSKFASTDLDHARRPGEAIGENTESVIVTILAPRALAASVSATVSLA